MTTKKHLPEICPKCFSREFYNDTTAKLRPVEKTIRCTKCNLIVYVKIFGIPDIDDTRQECIWRIFNKEYYHMWQ